MRTMIEYTLLFAHLKNSGIMISIGSDNMINIIECTNCHNHVNVNFLSGFAHLKCKHCNTEFQLHHSCIKFYLLIPFIAVGISIWFRISFINTEDIFIKTIVILFGSYLIHFVLCFMLIKLNIFKYSIRVGG